MLEKYGFLGIQGKGSRVGDQGSEMEG